MGNQWNQFEITDSTRAKKTNKKNPPTSPPEVQVIALLPWIHACYHGNVTPGKYDLTGG